MNETLSLTLTLSQHIPSTNPYLICATKRTCRRCRLGLTLFEISLMTQAMSIHDPSKRGSFSSLSSLGQPIKSAIKRRTTSSVRSNLVHPSKCVPSGIVGNKSGGLVMPTGGGLAKPAPSCGTMGSNGKISPQWGWYISTTPPTPEHYYASGKSKSSGKKHGHVAGERLPPPVAEEYPMPVFKQSPAPVFAKSGVKDVLGHDTLGWPSVPL